MRAVLILLFFGLAYGVQGQNDNSKKSLSTDKNQNTTKKKRPSAFDRNKFFKLDGKRKLYGGKEENQHFDIENMSLVEKQFHYGIGREVFPALLKPSFISVEKADVLWEDDERFLLAYSGRDVKAYSVKDLTRHEIVNDVLNGEPIMAAYCILADLGAIYSRQYGQKTLTFALSGYTYYDMDVWSGLDGFVLWDRETESLWWPLIGEAVSGSLKGVKLLEMDKAHWRDTKWKDIKESYPNAKVLVSGQDYKRPKQWERIKNVSNIVNGFSEKK